MRGNTRRTNRSRGHSYLIIKSSSSVYRIAISLVEYSGFWEEQRIFVTRFARPRSSEYRRCWILTSEKIPNVRKVVNFEGDWSSRSKMAWIFYRSAGISAIREKICRKSLYFRSSEFLSRFVEWSELEGSWIFLKFRRSEEVLDPDGRKNSRI